jgi:hypothetical protein
MNLALVRATAARVARDADRMFRSDRSIMPDALP